MAEIIWKETEVEIRKAAVISDCEDYRYLLTRIWEPSWPLLIFVMLNPSTADADLDDPTIRRCMRFAADNGFGGILVINLFAFRATEPAAMKKAADPVGPMNDAYLLKLIDGYPTRAGHRWIAAWGVHGRYRDRDLEVVNTLESFGVEVHCLGHSKDGDPRHPLYLPANSPIISLRRSTAQEAKAA